MPRIDPQQLLKCLSVLLSSNGGIKSQDEVQRLASLMTKFSKKLVSKCIYVSILKATETQLLAMFMSAGGWNLTYNWLCDGVSAKNWPLVTELVDLLLICPVDIDRLKTNACPKLIKTLSKDPTADENVRVLACKLVDLWLRIVRGDDSAPSTSDPGQPLLSTSSSELSKLNTDNLSDVEIKSETTDIASSDGHLPVYKITIRDGKKVLAEISGSQRLSSEAVEEGSSTGTEDILQEEGESVEDEVEDNINNDDDDEDYVVKPVKLRKKPTPTKPNKIIRKPAKLRGSNKKERESTESGSSSGKSPNHQATAKPISKKITNEQQKVKSNVTNKLNSVVDDIQKSEVANTKSNSANNDTEKIVKSKPKAKLNLSLKNKTSVNLTKEKEKSYKKFDKLDIKENKKQDNCDKSKKKVESFDSLTDKEKESLSKFITPPISKLGKIPKKSAANKEEKQSEEKNRTLKDDSCDNKLDLKKSSDTKKLPEVKRPEKKYSMSVEPKRSLQNESRPKTVKTFNSKFRSTGLEEEVKPPPSKSVPKKNTSVSPSPMAPEKKSVKRSSPPPLDISIPEKKPKPDSTIEEKKSTEKVGGIKLIPPKPKPMFLQESDVFMDAMLAANTMKEPRKRKRKPSISKDSGPSDPKREAGGSNSPTNSPKGDEISPSCVKPTFKFYQDTLETSFEEEKNDLKTDEESITHSRTSLDESYDDQKSISSEDDRISVKVEDGNSTLKGVLVHLKSRRQKKSVTWKEDALETIKYFELDETERVNVTKNFADMKSMEREHERENVHIARKLAVDDVMEEKTRWKALIPIDIAAPVVAPGKNSQEKDIQYAREKTVPAAIYFNKRTIPDSSAEPDLEIHATTDPAVIPLDDVTGSTDSINDFTSTPWPEPRVQPPAPLPTVVAPAPPAPTVPNTTPFQSPPMPFPQQPQPPFPTIGPFMPGPAPGMPMPPAGDCWRTADGKVVPMTPDMFPPPGMMGPGMPQMPPGPIMLPPGVAPDMPFPMAMQVPNPTPEEMAHFGGGFPPMGPTPPQMFGPPPPSMPQGPQSGNNWQGPGGNWFENDQGPPNHQGPSRFQGGSNWRGSRGGSNRNPDGWRRGGNSRTPMCNNVIKRGFCPNNNCRFRHR